MDAIRVEIVNGLDQIFLFLNLICENDRVNKNLSK